jgi:uncharacterized protein
MIGMLALVLFCAQSILAAPADDTQSARARTAPATAHPADTAYRQGQEAYDKKDYAAAMRAYGVAAAQGSALAQVGLGNLYGMGLGVPQNYSEALRWYRLAAAQGNSEAQNDVGFYYLSGWGVAKDDAQALSWLRKAADQGNEVAQRNIGMMYLQGMGVAADRTAAIRWFQRAAQNGDEDAKAALKYLGVK